MDAKGFLAEFGHIASAPGGVQRLRSLVLHLTVSGKLIPQQSGEFATNFIGKIEHERDKQINSGTFKKNQKLRAEIIIPPWQIPSNWKWVRFAELCMFSAGRTPSRKEAKYWNTGEYPWVSIRDLVHGTTINQTSETISQFARLEVFRRSPAKAGTLLMSFKLSIGKLSILGVDAYHNEAIIAIYPFAPSLKDYFFKCLSGFNLTQGNKAAIKGSTLNQDSITNILVALPPEEEIPRIVAKVDELMALCDKLEGQQGKRKTLRTQTRGMVLDALAKARDPSSLRQAWLRTSNNWGKLLDDEQGQDFLNDAVSAFAVRGLVSGWSGEKPDIEKIKADCAQLKQRYIRDGWQRKQKPIGLAQSASAVYPPHWAVVPFDEVAVVIGGVTKGRDLKGRETRLLPYLRVANVQRGFFDLGEMKQIEIPVEEIDKYRVETGDLLITEGGDWDKVGRTAIWAGKVLDCLHQNHVFKARIASSLLKAEWVELIFNSVIGRDYFAGASKQTTNLASINMSQLRSFPFPVPPLSEQVEILAKVKALTATCTTLKERWTAANRVARDLAAASVMSITGIRIEDKEDMKAPKTELVSRLRLGVSPADKDQAPLAALLIRNQGELAAKALWQASGLEIDDFYRQLKTEMARGWIVEPEPAYMREVAAS